MNAEHLEQLKKRHRYDEWSGGTEGQGSGASQVLRVPEDLLPQWRLHHADVLRQEGLPPMTQSIWTRGKDEALSVEIWECASTAAARELLLTLLGEFESPLVERITGPGSVGDVSFGQGEHMLLFARGNVVVQVRNAGRELVPVADPAREIDARLTRPTER
ncbi:MAG TPA: hypothetical protein VMW27_21070 [Thermoanaerobaculia bacterium]|nr:hypothetical protein [Thermoanaerobaculia bacterium]